MMITLGEANRLGHYTVTAEDGRDLYVQIDWDFPSLAGTFGWSPCHADTDGTIDCPVCGRTAMDLIADAVAYLDSHWGESVEDPGYFE